MAQDNIEEIKSKLDIVDVISEYLQVKRAGTNFRALCPFHSEKTPSFFISPDRQIWHCFGCGEGGDIFGFVMKMEGMEFPEALRVLAKKAGVQLAYRDPALANQKTKLLDICKMAADFYHQILLDSSLAKSAREYLKKRQVSEDTVDLFKLGYAPEAWETVNKFLVRKGFKEEDIFLDGLTIKKEKGVGFYDRFRNRLMFPIADIHGNIIGFGGRWLGSEKEEVAKYINSPQTLVYNKSAVLYGIDRAKEQIRKKKQAIVVEGYMDMLASYEVGVQNVVASSGTALTMDQVKLLKRYTTNIAFAFDTDIAGEDASKRGIDVVLAQDLEVKIITLPFGKDPDELIRKNKKAWPEAIVKAQSIMDYYFGNTLKKADLNKVQDKKKVASTLLSMIAKLADSIEQSHYIQKLAGILKVKEELLWDKLQQSKKAKIIKSEKEQPSAILAKDRFQALGEQILGMAFYFPDHLNYIIDHLSPDYLADENTKKLYKRLIIYYTEKRDFDHSLFIEDIKKENKKLAQYADILFIKTEQNFAESDDELIDKEIIDGINQLKRNFIVKELKILEDTIKDAEKENDKGKLNNCIEKCNNLTKELSQLS